MSRKNSEGVNIMALFSNEKTTCGEAYESVVFE